MVGVLLVGLVHGLIYLLLMPPWQHYDEPGHFENAWLIATRRSLPRAGDYDQDLRRRLVISMAEHGFYRDLPFGPNLDPREGQPIWIGEQQAGTPPLSHIFVALIFAPLSATRFAQDVVLLLYAGRLLSLGLYLAVLGLAYAVTAELTPPGHPLRWMVPLSLALLPGYTDLMTALNDDVGAVFIFSVFLWGAVRLIRRGFSLGRAAWVLASALLGVFTKNTALLGLPLALLALVFALLRRQERPVVKLAIVAGLAGLLAGPAFLGWGDAALWYRTSGKGPQTRRLSEQAPLGRQVVALAAGATELRQPLLGDDLDALRGQSVTLGAWVWASEPVETFTLGLFDGRHKTGEIIQVTTTPVFHTLRGAVAPDARQIQIVLRPFPNLTPARAGTLYYDGVVLAAGEWPAGTAPDFGDAQAGAGVWAGQTFENRARNGSAEQAWPRLRPWVESAFSRYAAYYLSPATLLHSVLDFDKTAGLYAGTANRLFTTFWGAFAWGNVALPAAAYALLKVFTGLGLLGAAAALWQSFRRAEAPWQWAIVWLGLAVVGVWASVALRSFFNVLDRPGFAAVARYGYPAIVPTMLALAAGWRQWLGRPAGRRALWLFGVFLVLDVVSVYTVFQFYSGGR